MAVLAGVAFSAYAGRVMRASTAREPGSSEAAGIRPGAPLVYTAESIAVAVLENLVHMTRQDFPRGYVCVAAVRLCEGDDPRGVRADQLRRIRDVLAHLDEARQPSDLSPPGYRLHPLRGDLKGIGA